MKVRIWGCRGSLAAPGPETVRYGGNTSCVEVRLSDGTVLVLDAGTGMRPLGLHLGTQQHREVHVLLSHLHLDHLQGLGFFAPLYDPDVELHLWGPVSPTRSLEERIATYLSPPLFPVELGDVPSRVHFHDAPEGSFTVGSATITAAKVSHQGPTIGYRIAENGRCITYIPDHEPAPGMDLRGFDPEWISGHDLAVNCDVLLHDAQYSEEEYPAKVGWGHSSIDHVVVFGQKVGARRLVLFHHDPLHADAELERLLARARELWGDHPGAVELGYEGQVIDLGADVPASDLTAGAH